MLTDQPLKTYTIVGIVEFDGEAVVRRRDRASSSTPPTAQQVLNLEGRFTEITVAADDGVSETELRDRIRRSLPAKTPGDHRRRRSPSEQASDVKQGLGFFNTFLLTFALIALFVGAFIIFNTFSMLVAQRTRELALMRMLGASRGQVRRAVLLEAVVVGLLSSVIGLIAGIGVAIGLKALFGVFGAQLPDGPTIVATRTVIVSFVVGTLVTAAAAFMPARRASRVAPLAALRDAATPDRSLKRQTIIGAVVLVVGAACDDQVAAATAGCSSSGWAPCSPSSASRCCRRWSAGRSPRSSAGCSPAGCPAGSAGRTRSRNPRRTAATAAALMIGLALISAVTVLGSSLKASVAKTVEGAVNADFILNTQRAGLPRRRACSDAAKQDGVQQTAGVKVDGMQLCDNASCSARRSRSFVTAFPAPAIGDLVNITTVDGSRRARARTRS